MHVLLIGLAMISLIIYSRFIASANEKGGVGPTPSTKPEPPTPPRPTKAKEKRKEELHSSSNNNKILNENRKMNGDAISAHEVGEYKKKKLDDNASIRE